jgi:hypothetical protein
MALEREGIKSFLPDLFTAQANPFLSTVLGGIRVQVNANDYDKAIQIATEFLKVRQETNTNDAENLPEWKCPNCGEIVDGTFGCCWNCETENRC